MVDVSVSVVLTVFVGVDRVVIDVEREVSVRETVRRAGVVVNRVVRVMVLVELKVDVMVVVFLPTRVHLGP